MFLTVLITILASGVYVALMLALPDPERSDQHVCPGSAPAPRHAADPRYEALLFRELVDAWLNNSEHWFAQDFIL